VIGFNSREKEVAWSFVLLVSVVHIDHKVHNEFKNNKIQRMSFGHHHGLLAKCGSVSLSK
jgi:hypothetical protein